MREDVLKHKCQLWFQKFSIDKFDLYSNDRIGPAEFDRSSNKYPGNSKHSSLLDQGCKDAGYIESILKYIKHNNLHLD